MTPAEFRDIRIGLGLTQPELAVMLGFNHGSTVGALESARSGKAITLQVERLMRAYEAGYRPADWPKVDT
jgi:transcriptional regulator with XRE-family HTH domain